MLRYYFIVLVTLISLSASAQEPHDFDGKKWEAPYFLETPEGWGIERFGIPIAFAPSIPYKGVEDIRFTPGWGKRESTEYWSYTFLWYLDSMLSFDVNTIEKNLSAYYTGLLHANLDTTKMKAADVPTATAAIKSIKAGTGAEGSFEGTINTLDFLTWKPITFHLRIHIKKCTTQNKTFVFHEVSPKPYTDAVWKSLDRLWLGLRCTK